MENLAELKGIVARLQASLEKETIKEFQSDILAAIRFNKRRVCVLERRVGIGLTVCLCVGLMGCEPVDSSPDPPVPSEDSSAWVETMKANVSAYCPCERCCGKWAELGVNATGERVTSSQHVIRAGDHFVAADRRFPFGTLLSIPGYSHGNPVPVLDRGGKIKGNCIDVYFSTHQEALNFGRQFLTVTIERKEL